ncbi:hypothetical protein BGZ95_004272 [Linnemannia exigua]|uniref:Uncharacterized protein n=1 Tax=Linnemannia exigua TaxID=604196 RepID=A0AAD4DHX0_9FUNG|nr:hypothetical protein BGZ95_004272 [Linnemannia exigua]
MGIFQKPLLQARYENEDVQISAELCSNIAINVVGLAKGEITIISGNEDMIQIRTSVQAKGAIIKNAAALEPLQDGNQYRYTIHTPLEDKLEKAVTFQVFITIPRQLDSLESFTIEGTNLDLAIGDISHTFIRCLNVNIGRGDTTIDSFYGELATMTNTIQGGFTGKYSVARLVATARSGKLVSKVHLLNTDDQLPSPRVICSTFHHRIDLQVDGSDLFGPFTVEAKTQCAPLDVKLQLSNSTAAAMLDSVADDQRQRVLGNFINFGGHSRIRVSRSFQGRLETRTHYGKIFIEDPEFVVLEGATLTLPSASDRNAPMLEMSSSQPQSLSIHSGSASLPSPNSYLSNVLSSRSSSQGTGMSCGGDDYGSQPPLSPVSAQSTTSQYLHFKKGVYNSNSYSNKPPSASGGSTNGSENNSRAESTTGSLNEGGTGSSPGSVNGISSNRAEKEKEKQRKREEEEYWRFMTKEVIGTFGQGVGLIMAKNSSGDIAVELF